MNKQLIAAFSLALLLGAGCAATTPAEPADDAAMEDSAMTDDEAMENDDAMMEDDQTEGDDAMMEDDKMSGGDTYTIDEVAKHSTPDDCWLVIDGKVLDVSGFGDKHGGGDAVYEGCGIDATTLFETRPMGSGTPHSDKARGFMPNFEIGTLAE